MMVDIEGLKKAMEVAGLNINTLANKSNVDKATISRLFTGKSSCSIGTAQKLSIALNLSTKSAGNIFFAKSVATLQR